MNILNKYCRIIRILFLFIIFSIIFKLGYGFVQIEGTSMSPTFLNKEWILADKWSYKFFLPEKGDVINVKDPIENVLLTKRILACPGETIEIKNGLIYVNNNIVTDEFKNDRIQFLLNDGTIVYVDFPLEKLKKDEYWVIGDNRKESWYGIIKLKNIKDKLIL